jgi:hypothetical protein
MALDKGTPRPWRMTVTSDGVAQVRPDADPQTVIATLDPEDARVIVADVNSAAALAERVRRQRTKLDAVRQSLLAIAEGHVRRTYTESDSGISMSYEVDPKGATCSCGKLAQECGVAEAVADAIEVLEAP